VDPLPDRIDGDSGGTFEIALAALEAANRPLILSTGIEDEDFSGFRIGDVDVVLGIDRDALWPQHGVLAFFAAFNELVFLLGEVEDMDAAGAGIGDDDASVGIGGNAVGAD